MPPRQRHQGIIVRVRRGAGGVLAQGRRRPVLLSAFNLLMLASIQLHLSLSLYAPTRSPLACARPPATRTDWSERRTRVSCPGGPPWGLWFVWEVSARSREGDARRKQVAAAGESVYQIGSVYRHYRLAQPCQPHHLYALHPFLDSWRPYACRTCRSPPRSSAASAPSSQQHAAPLTPAQSADLPVFRSNLDLI